MADEPKLPGILNVKSANIDVGSGTFGNSFGKLLSEAFSGAKGPGISTQGGATQGSGLGGFAASGLGTTIDAVGDMGGALANGDNAFTAFAQTGTKVFGEIGKAAGATDTTMGRAVETAAKLGVGVGQLGVWSIHTADKINNLNKAYAEAVAQSGEFSGNLAATPGVLDKFNTELGKVTAETGMSIQDINAHVTDLIKNSIDMGVNLEQGIDKGSSAAEKSIGAYENFTTAMKVARNSGIDLGDAMNMMKVAFTDIGMMPQDFAGLMAQMTKSIQGTGVSATKFMGTLNDLGQEYQFLQFDATTAGLAIAEVAKRQASGGLHYKSTEQAITQYGKALEATKGIQEDLGKSMFFGTMTSQTGMQGAGAALEFEDLNPEEALKRVTEGVTTMTGGRAIGKEEAKAASKVGDEGTTNAFITQRSMYMEQLGMGRGQADKFMDLVAGGMPATEAKDKAMQEQKDALGEAKGSDTQYQKMLYDTGQITNQLLGETTTAIQALPNKLLKVAVQNFPNSAIGKATGEALTKGKELLGTQLGKVTYQGFDSSGGASTTNATPPIGSGVVTPTPGAGAALKGGATSLKPSGAAKGGAPSGKEEAGSALQPGAQLIEAAGALKAAAASLIGAGSSEPSPIGAGSTASPAPSVSEAPSISANETQKAEAAAAQENLDAAKGQGASKETANKAQADQKAQAEQAQAKANVLGKQTLSLADVTAPTEETNLALAKNYAGKSQAAFGGDYAFTPQYTDTIKGKPEQGKPLTGQGYKSKGPNTKMGQLNPLDINTAGMGIGGTEKGAMTTTAQKITKTTTQGSGGAAVVGQSYAEALPDQIKSVTGGEGLVGKYGGGDTNLTDAESSALDFTAQLQQILNNTPNPDDQAKAIVDTAEDQKAEWRLEQGAKFAESNKRTDLAKLFKDTRNAIVSARATVTGQASSTSSDTYAALSAKTTETTKTTSTKTDFGSAAGVAGSNQKGAAAGPEGMQLPKQGMNSMDAFKGSTSVGQTAATKPSMELGVPSVAEIKKAMQSTSPVASSSSKPGLASEGKAAQDTLSQKPSPAASASGAGASSAPSEGVGGGSGGKSPEIIVKVMLKDQEIGKAVVTSAEFDQAVKKIGGKEYAPKKSKEYVSPTK